MGFGITVESEELLANEDRRWLGTRDGTTNQRSITLLASLFTADHLINGSLPSGLVLAKVASGANAGFYGPYAGDASESQTITVNATGGTYTLTFGDQTTAPISFNATAAAVKSALVALGDINDNDITVTGGPGGSGGTSPYTVAFGGQYLGQDVPQMTANSTGLTGAPATATVATTVAGDPDASDGLDNAEGHLYSTLGKFTPGSTQRIGVALWWFGVCKTLFLPVPVATSGRLDAAAKARLGNFIRYES